MKQKISKALVTATLLTLTLTFLGGCVYYNTMYHARRWFNEAESLRKQNNRDVAAGQENRLYSDAIVKCSNILAEHPTSSWVDDALFIIGKSFYHLDQNPKAERKFRELLSSFPDSKYATESRFYLGKTQYKLENYETARETFAEFMKEGSEKKWRAEATYLMGEIAAAEGDTARAVEYLSSYLQEFKGGPLEQEVQYKVGQLQYELDNYSEAASAFGRSARITTDPAQRFNALYEQGKAYYRLDSVEAGLAVFRGLESEQQDSVKLGVILLRIAEGLLLKGEEREAILLFYSVGEEFNQRPEAAEAWYEIGVIMQEDWSDLELAKQHFDLATKIQRGGEFRAAAIERAAEITKVETFRALLSSDEEVEASRSQFLLAELYRTTLNSPDSALSEYQNLVRTFPESGYAPKALLNIGYLYEAYYDDPESASDYYSQVLADYPQSDEVTSALKLLGDDAVEPGLIYPEKLYRMAEAQRYDQQDLDSALALYQLFMTEFPNSEMVPKADFAAAKIRLAQFVPSEDPPSKNPYWVADSLLTAEAAVADSIAGAERDSVAAIMEDSVQASAPPPVTSTSESDSAVSMSFAGDSTVIDTSGALSENIRLTDFLGSRLDEESPQNADSLQIPSEELTDSLVFNPDADTAGQTATESFPDSASAGAATLSPDSATDSATAAGALPRDATPRDRKRISLENFPSAQRDSLADSTTVPGDSLTGDAGSFPGDSLGLAPALIDSLGADSTSLDSVEVVVVDSSMIWLFQHLSNKYQGTDIGNEAARLAKGETNQRPKRQIQEPPQPQAPITAVDTSTVNIDSLADPFALLDTTSEAQYIEEALREEIDKWPLMQDEPITLPEFDYPVEAASNKFEGRVVTKIKIDFDGRVTEVELLKGTNVPLLDLEVRNTLLETYFDPLKIEPLHLGSYFIYNYEIVLPEVFR